MAARVTCLFLCLIRVKLVALPNQPCVCCMGSSLLRVPPGSPSCGGDITVYVWHKPTELAHSFLFCSCVCFCLYGPSNCISFHKFAWELSVFSLCSSSLVSALLVLSAIYLFMKVSFSPDIIPSGWLGSKLQFTNSLLSLCSSMAACYILIHVPDLSHASTHT